MSESGTYRQIPRDPRLLSWRRGPLPEPEAGMGVLVFRPHFALPCAATTFYLIGQTMYEGGPIAWHSSRGLFEDELGNEDWWAYLGPDAEYVFVERLMTESQP